MTRMHRRASQFAFACLMATSLSACGGFDGIELNGKIFDALGMSTASLGPRAEPKVEQRSPLVLPPNAERLPEPGSAPPVVASANDQNWPADREEKKRADAEAAKRKQAEYCRDGNWKEKALKDDAAAENGPAGACGSIFSVFSKGLFGAQE